MATVSNLFRSLGKHTALQELREAQAVENGGLEGCQHAHRGGNRQVLLVDRETLEAMDLRPGTLFENITTVGLNVNGLEMGQQLRVGEARIEISVACTPCNQMEKIRPGLRKELWGRRGMLGRVVEGGMIRVGDRIEKIVTV